MPISRASVDFKHSGPYIGDAALALMVPRPSIKGRFPAEEVTKLGNSYQTQDLTPDLHTKVNAGWSHDHQGPTSDFIIAARDGSGHQHVVMDQYGNEIHNQWVPGR